MKVSEAIKNSKKIVVKIGSNTLADEKGYINKDYISKFAHQVHTLRQMGKEIVIVTSGAQLAGLATLNKWTLKGEVHYKQALCAIGQVELMDAYRKSFNEYGIHIGQMLFTKDDFCDDHRSLNIRNTLFTLIDEDVIPIVNENDTVSVAEIKIGDNDTLGARTAHLWNADLLILLSDIDGIFDKNPKYHPDAKLIEEIKDVDNIHKIAEIGQADTFGTGGMHTKIQAAKIVNKCNISMVLANGGKENIILDLLEGKERASIFLGEA